MKILVDADGCPVVDIIAEAAKQHGVACWIRCDTSPVFEKDGATARTVSKGADSVDFALVNRVAPGDLVVTQDDGLAAMCLSRQAVVINQDGMEYTAENMDSLLLARHTAQKIRKAGGRRKGPKKRSAVQNESLRIKRNQLLSRRGDGG